jgi:hypothetical protein
MGDRKNKPLLDGGWVLYTRAESPRILRRLHDRREAPIARETQPRQHQPQDRTAPSAQRRDSRWRTELVVDDVGVYGVGREARGQNEDGTRRRESHAISEVQRGTRGTGSEVVPRNHAAGQEHTAIVLLVETSSAALVSVVLTTVLVLARNNGWNNTGVE